MKKLVFPLTFLLLLGTSSCFGDSEQDEPELPRQEEVSHQKIAPESRALLDWMLKEPVISAFLDYYVPIDSWQLQEGAHRGKVKEILVATTSNGESSRMQYLFDKNGNITLERESDDDDDYYYVWSGERLQKFWKEERKERQTFVDKPNVAVYNDQNQIVAIRDEESGEVYSITYDLQARVITCENHHRDKCELYYDESYKLIRFGRSGTLNEVVYNAQGKVTKVSDSDRTYSYSPQGDLLEYWPGRMSPAYGSGYPVSYQEYDAQGNWLKRVIYDSDGSERKRQVRKIVYY